MSYNDFNDTPLDDSLFNAASDTANGLRSKWNELEPVAKVALALVGLVIAVLFARFILPALAAAMGLGLLLLILFVPYWAPTIIAFIRKHPSKLAIGAVNFFFGWTFLGWVISLVWSLSNSSSNQVHQQVIVNNVVAAPAPAHMAPPAQLPNGGQAQVGDVVNGHRFNGMQWVPINDTPPMATIQPPPPPAQPAPRQPPAASPPASSSDGPPPFGRNR